MKKVFFEKSKKEYLSKKDDLRDLSDFIIERHEQDYQDLFLLVDELNKFINNVEDKQYKKFLKIKAFRFNALFYNSFSYNFYSFFDDNKKSTEYAKNRHLELINNRPSILKAVFYNLLFLSKRKEFDKHYSEKSTIYKIVKSNNELLIVKKKSLTKT